LPEVPIITPYKTDAEHSGKFGPESVGRIKFIIFGDEMKM
jgi:hypothetical protein